MRAAAAPQPPATRTTAPVRTPSTSPSLRPTPVTSLGPADHGVRAWDALTGGECLRAFPSAWRLRYDVVACRAPHAAQVTRTVALAGDAYPGRPALKAR